MAGRSKEADKNVNTGNTNNESVANDAEQIVKAAEEKAEALIKAAEKKIEEMFSNAQNTAAAPTIENITIQQPEEKKASLPDYIKNMQEDMKKEEEISLFKDGGKYSEDVYASVNGEHRFQIQRGKKVKVPKYIAEVIKSSQEQDTKTEEMMRQKQEESLKRLSEMK